MYTRYLQPENEPVLILYTCTVHIVHCIVLYCSMSPLMSVLMWSLLTLGLLPIGGHQRKRYNLQCT